MSNHLTPFIYWAQTEDQITLKVDLTDVKDLDVNLTEDILQVAAYGQGAKGLNNYTFDLSFYAFINSNESSYKVIDRQIDFVLKKAAKGWWPRLISQPQKPSWIKIDFDKWKSEDVDDEEEKRDILHDYPDMYDQLHREEFGYRKEDFTKVYLIIYNLCQFVGFLYILSIIGIRYLRQGSDSIRDTYETLSIPFKFVQVLQFLEVLHPILGCTKGSPFICFIQVGCRTFILFFMIDAEPRIQVKPVVFYLFIIWSAIDVIRYPYYIMRQFKVEFYFLIWLRYTIWIPLYPLGFLCEGIIVLRNIPYFEESKKFTITLPNAYNFTLDFPSVLRIYLLLFFLPGIHTLLSHMNKLRRAKLGKFNIRWKQG